MKIIERNLQELGKSLFVSLPKDWANTFKLKKGSKIKMVVGERGFISIAPEFTNIEKQKETEMEFDRHFKRKFFREYFMGNEKITILFNKKIKETERKEIYSFLKRFMTVQIIEENESKIILKSFKIEELSIEECMKRLYFISLNMMEELIAGKNKVMLSEMRDNMTKFYYLLVMQIRRYLEEGKFTKENQISLIRAMDYRMISEKMQRIVEIIQNLEEIKDLEVASFLKEIKDYYAKSALSFINSNYEKAPYLWEEGERIERENKRLLNKIEKLKNNIMYKQVLDLFQILRYAREISSLIR
ncbi:Uncharacterised protein [uncultured archaeon]|nr:Uncharacterised protein [uncultured archaeon]